MTDVLSRNRRRRMARNQKSTGPLGPVRIRRKKPEPQWGWEEDSDA
jgi:hypothetical protein